MDGVTLAEAEAHLGELVSRAEAGETIEICRDGKAVVRLVAVEPVHSSEGPRQAIDFAALKAFTDSLPFQEESSADIVRRMRDEARY
jgi:prevent-host-death family protein